MKKIFSEFFDTQLLKISEADFYKFVRSHYDEKLDGHKYFLVIAYAESVKSALNNDSKFCDLQKLYEADQTGELFEEISKIKDTTSIFNVVPGKCEISLILDPIEDIDERSINELTEAMDIDENEYGDDRMENLCRTFTIESAEEVKQKILKDISLFTKDIDQSDDLTFVILKVN